MGDLGSRRHLGAGRRLTGTVSPVFGDRLVSVTYSKLDGRHLLQSWIPLLALIAYAPSRDWSAICIGRPKRGTTPRHEEMGRPAEVAVDLLVDLVAMYDVGRYLALCRWMGADPFKYLRR